MSQDPSTRGPRGSSTSSPRTPGNGGTCGTTPPTGRAVTSSSPTSTTTCPPSAPPSSPSKPRCDRDASGSPSPLGGERLVVAVQDGAVAPPPDPGDRRRGEVEAPHHLVSPTQRPPSPAERPRHRSLDG